MKCTECKINLGSKKDRLCRTCRRNKTQQKEASAAFDLDADREMFGDDADYFEVAGMTDIGCK